MTAFFSNEGPWIWMATRIADNPSSSSRPRVPSVLYQPCVSYTNHAGYPFPNLYWLVPCGKEIPARLCHRHQNHDSSGESQTVHHWRRTQMLHIEYEDLSNWRQKWPLWMPETAAFPPVTLAAVPVLDRPPPLMTTILHLLSTVSHPLVMMLVLVTRLR